MSVILHELLILMFSIYSIGRPKHVRVMAGALEGDIFLGPKAEVLSKFFTFFMDKYLWKISLKLMSKYHTEIAF